MINETHWEYFKKDLPHTIPPFNKRNWGNGIHSLCSYYGKLKPSLAHHLVEVFSRPGDLVLDIFSGSGTVLFESINKGRSAIGFDINPISVAISSGKCGAHNKERVKQELENLDKHIKGYVPTKQELDKARAFGFNKTLEEYYESNTLNEILASRDYFKGKVGKSVECDLIIGAFLHILHGNRPYALSRRSHPITPYAPTGDFEYREVMPRLEKKVYKSIEQLESENLSSAQVFQQDVLSEWPTEVKDIDLILTSPPFFDSTKYYLTNWIRNWFLGWEKEDFNIKKEEFVDTLQKSSLEIYEDIFKKCFDTIVHDGAVVFHLGKSKKLDMGKALKPIAEKVFTNVELFNEDVSKVENHGVSDKGSVNIHQYLVMRK